MGTLEKDLKNFYEKYGPIVRIDLLPGKIRWMFAFVEFEEPSAAQQARDLSEGTFIHAGHVIKTNDETVKSCIPETPYEYPMFTFASSNSSIGGVMASRDVVHYAFDSLPYCAEAASEEESEQGTMASSSSEGTRIPNLGIIVFTHPWHGFSLHYSIGGVGDLLDCKFSLSGLSDKLYRVSNSYDGLICVIGEKTAYVINPATKEFLELPSGTHIEKKVINAWLS
ncbi:hypothetical protein QJS10_CPB20g02121 [Acorus calamus]|uniref:RRM domain-containing protein n=1 Tax=Acorus calamus TaxID=4465 RepID=A0AAV9CCC4_ACOCL|nr:hypothetical protein QJS10_CPB20g02121 [Acorus calamus]